MVDDQQVAGRARRFNAQAHARIAQEVALAE